MQVPYIRLKNYAPAGSLAPGMHHIIEVEVLCHDERKNLDAQLFICGKMTKLEIPIYACIRNAEEYDSLNRKCMLQQGRSILAPNVIPNTDDIYGRKMLEENYDREPEFAGTSQLSQISTSGMPKLTTLGIIQPPQ